MRKKEGDKIFAVFNFSPGFSGATLLDTLFYGTYKDAFTDDMVSFGQGASVTLSGWDYHIYEQTGTTIGIANDYEILQEFVLEQNYPNPFNPATKIHYTVGSRQIVSIKVYDLLGKEIETLVNEKKPAGKYSVAFEGDNLSSGIYLYRLQAGDFTETRKMLLLQ